MKQPTSNSPAEVKPEAVEQQPDEVANTATAAPVEAPDIPEADAQTEITNATAAAVLALNTLTATLDKHGYSVWTWGQLVNAGFIACVLNKETGTAEFVPGDFSGAYLLKRQEQTDSDEEAPAEPLNHHAQTGRPRTRLVNGKGSGQWVNSHYKQE